MKGKVLKITEKGIALSLFGFVASSPVSITATQGFFLLGMLLWIIKSIFSIQNPVSRIQKSAFKQMDGLKWSILLFFLAGIVASLTSLNPRESFFDLRDFGFLFIIYFVANHIRGEKRLKELLHLLIAITTLTAIYGIGQAIMGMDRVKGPQAMTLTFAGILIIVLSLTWSWLLFHAKGRERWILLFEALILSAALLLTYTRGAWLGLLMGLVILGMFSKPSFGLRRRLLVPAVFLLYISAFSIPRPVAERAQSIGDPSNPDRNIRFLMWKESLRVLRDYPITGVGLVDLLPIYDRYVYPKAPPDLKHIHYGHFHNNFVQVAVQMGLLGLTAFLFLWFNIIRREFRILRKIQQSSIQHPESRLLYSVLLGSLAALAAFLVSGLFEYNYGDSEVAMLLFFTIGISLACEKIRFSNEQ